jgi:alkylated DNA repair protein (DNA oxidative demethylase)
MELVLPSARSRMRSSRLGGVPATLPALDAPPAGQLHLGLGDDGGTPANERRLARPQPGVAVLHGWLDADEQRALAADFRAWARPPAGLRHPRVPAGHVMSIQSVCLGWHWQPYRYSRTADDTDGAPVKPMPAALIALARRAVRATHPIDADSPGDPAPFAPDAAIVNLYPPGAKLGLHQDGEEPSDAPVVTVSLGDTCTFRLAGVDRRTGPFTDLTLRSGDVLVFGGRNRRVFHGVPKVAAGTSPSWLGLLPGRLSITIRETGLA